MEHSPALTAFIIVVGIVASTFAVVYVAYSLVSSLFTQQSSIILYSGCVFENGTLKVNLFSPKQLTVSYVKINGEVFYPENQIMIYPGTNTYYINTGDENLSPQSKVMVSIFFNNGEEISFNTTVI
ncbi:hypothetical protein [Acidianus ambivalens]|uniref:Archaeal Type IV pilin N-terminal domain-containing protein n=1 Tax=Acidianus ambivalens TaxID=2283 RepID=A0A650CU14_ACIAM|nr:hypothetical protein [Acidianus ambivalens]MQL56177.1 hypothetical protein [Acidianus ambivalens]QGR21283.1 hypothetical protein D1866_04190 [Acidianus ambivalens]